MTDNFEKAQQRILKEAKANGGVTTDHLLDALIATNEDLDVQHVETARWHTEIHAMVEGQIERLEELESWRIDTQATCVKRVKQLIEAEHDDRHGKHVAEMHKIDEEAYDIKKLYRMLKWIVVVLGGGILLILADQLGNIIFGGAT